MLHSSHPWLLSPSCSRQFWHLVISLLLLHLNPYPFFFFVPFHFLLESTTSGSKCPKKRKITYIIFFRDIEAITLPRAKAAFSQTAHLQYASVFTVNENARKKMRAVTMSFLFQITMNDNIIISKQLFMIPGRKAHRLRNSSQINQRGSLGICTCQKNLNTFSP